MRKPRNTSALPNFSTFVDDKGRDCCVFEGIVYPRTVNGYYRSGRWVLLHREVWRFYNGEIPEGYHIHHKDEDKSNNKLDNLELVTPKEHYEKHKDSLVATTKLTHAAKKADGTSLFVYNNPAKLEKNRKLLSDLAIERMNRPESREFFSKRMVEVHKTKAPVEYTCLFCGQSCTSLAMRKALFCNNNCGRKYHRRNKKLQDAGQ